MPMFTGLSSAPNRSRACVSTCSHPCFAVLCLPCLPCLPVSGTREALLPSSQSFLCFLTTPDLNSPTQRLPLTEPNTKPFSRAQMWLPELNSRLKKQIMGDGMEQRDGSLITGTVLKLDKTQTTKELTVRGKLFMTQM